MTKISNLAQLPAAAAQRPTENQPEGDLQSRKVVVINKNQVLAGSNKGIRTGNDTVVAVVLLCIIFFPLAIPILLIAALVGADSCSSRRRHRHHHYQQPHHPRPSYHRPQQHQVYATPHPHTYSYNPAW